MSTNLPKAPYAICDKCPLKDRPVALTTGPKDAKVAVVSRSPGHYEAIQGESFSGPSGKVLDHLLALQGKTRADVLATNVVLCQSDGNEPGFGMALECCRPRLEAEIADCETVIACGVEAAYAINNDPNISRNRGYVHYRDLSDVHGTDALVGVRQRVIVTNNPAVVLRDDATYPELVRDFRLAINPLPQPKLPQVRWIDNIDEAKAVAVEMEKIITNGTLVSTDIETRGREGGTGLQHTAEIVCCGFSIRPERALVFGESPCSSEEFRTNYLRRLYERSDVRYLWHNGKYDIKVLRTQGIQARVDEDTMLLSWCLDERPGDPESGAGGHALEWLLKDELGWEKYEPTSVRNFKKTGVLSDHRARIDLYQYNGMDCAGALSLFQIYESQARNDNVWERPYRLLLIRLSEHIAQMELQGNLYNAEEACNILESTVWPKLRELRANMRELSATTELNPNSHQQVGKLFYEDWGLRHNLKRPKIESMGKRSVDKAVREEILIGNATANYARVHPERLKLFTQDLDTFKELDKQRGTYLEGLVLKRFADGRIYTEFKISGTESGRLSSANPNMQNITRPKPGLPNIRSVFSPDPGCVYISGDLSQAELRTIAVLSGDTALQSIYLDTNRSLHKEVAAEFYGEDHTHEQYVRAKNINFGVAYWQSAFSFAQMYHMPASEAQSYIDYWWERFPKVWEWTKATEEEVLTKGELQSPFGHKRRFYVIPADQSGRLHVVKEGINFRPQNIAANITLWALCSFSEKVDWSIAQPRITVHDNIVVNCRIDYLDEVALLLKACMEEAVRESIGWDFPFLADISIGHDWGNLEVWESQPRPTLFVQAV
jgi:uracil-DNA glycosylase family 4